jgi:glycosyltransferase involved in cell wall biosynthesis
VNISLIITTYDRPDALELSILSALRQTRPPEEILIADDGSGEETILRVDRLAEESPIPIHHIRQSHRGFRAAMIRNKAMAGAKGQYILLVDGDMILHRDFVQDHEAAARPGYFSQGSRVLITEEKTAEVLRTRQMEFSPFEPGLMNRKNAVRSPFLSRCFSRSRSGLRGIRTCNFAFWMSDALSVNGFNEDFEGWGREDSEFAARMLNRGVFRQDIKFSALAFHLYHPLRSLSSLSLNDQLLENTVRNCLSRCTNGMDKYLQQ